MVSTSKGKFPRRFTAHKETGRGMLVLWVLSLLKKKPMNGYEIMKEIERSTTYWKPTSGALYPTLIKMEKHGLLKAGKIGERSQKIYSLTESGKALAGHIIEHMTKKMRDVKARRMLDSLMWPEEPEEVKDAFEGLLAAVFDFRDSLKNKYSNPSYIGKAKVRIARLTKALSEKQTS
jgi:DNA-binding PadR family transcriptional regulator